MLPYKGSTPSVRGVMKKEEYANLELDELIPMVLEIFAQIDVQTI